MAHVMSSDRNAYDRFYFNAHGRSGSPFLLAGIGVYPNLGVIDGYATVRVADRQLTVRAADALDGHDRLAPSVGPLRIEVIEPLESVRLVCEGDDHGVGFDLTWQGSFPAVDEAPHRWRSGPRITLDAQRFAQVGTWEGELRVDGTTHTVSHDRWVGTRDRSWGIRPVGEPEPPGRGADEPIEGFWWNYVPLRFDDFALVVIVQEDPDGHRVLNDAVRVWPAASGRRSEQLGWPRVEVRYRPGSRHPEGAVLHLSEHDGRPVTIDIDTLGFVALTCGPGYNGDPDWTHGQWRGRGWVEGSTCNLADPTVAARLPFSTLDHVARARCDGAEGWGLFEHAVIGRHAPSGFADLAAMAP